MDEEKSSFWPDYRHGHYDYGYQIDLSMVMGIESDSEELKFDRNYFIITPDMDMPVAKELAKILEENQDRLKEAAKNA